MEVEDMLTIKENTTLVGISELRTKIDEILKKAKEHRVLIEKRNKLVAVLMDIENYNRIEKILDALEDIALGYLAKERDIRSTEADYIDIEGVEKKLKK
jgi:prevent-host-death family protein